MEHRVLCLTEAIDHMADDALRQPLFAFAENVESFSDKAFLEAVEAEDEPRAVGLMRGALEKGIPWSELEPTLARAALSHYNDFGHAAIYVHKTGELLSLLGAGSSTHLLLPLARYLCYTTRDDLLPDFRPYALALQAAPSKCGNGRSWIDGEAVSGSSVNEALSWTRERMKSHREMIVYSALLEAGALNLLRFDESFEKAASPSVSRNVNWLSFTHALTFANAVRTLGSGNPELWPRALLQMACFVGRNKRFLRAEIDDQHWVDDEERFLRDARRRVLDHGFGEPIFSAHLVKILRAVETELAFVSPSCRKHLLAAFSRFLDVRIKEKHPLRVARQALALTK